ncbi:extracellular solute-binding protein [Paenibacillus thiaminolyticus]|uniref:Extracellular solute-binding protein n=1 Tax=Paenibacillus thiaminolyticus TaxID=49283 RepID=A0AAP9DZB6_PANTH|nr:extracellular solute-binding protein [Paenibacillus thiaminolyticus]MCY9537939.1 extracellular solute-binding protein [Paenibacillus thiaminolyticus]MCY9605349.1 extracellular solute-binding protein [Paenibacillus thiaminolyticus]MCY9606858.1 extracellular solute-binding protein [Paenibacillus thiaminolyticus]MCY9612661.1 extracellular solute-binding protein [Paenibacillus thiaminolyticus]MCY9620147.1 extracellular solute-binding protein [Paenibacillus thiaminolyticus]
MQFKGRKIVSLLLACSMAVGLLTACGGGGGTKESNADGGQSAGDEGKKYSVSAMNILYGAAPPTTNSSGIKAIEERYGIEFKYIPVAAGDYANKIGVTVASGDMPDLMLLEDTNANYFSWAGNGMFLPIEDYIKDYPNLSKIPQEIWDMLTYEGHIYGVPRLRGIPFQTMVIRQDWLDKLGLKMPATYDELYTVMKAFAENDPDGNGKKDTYGFALDGNFSGFNGLFGSYRSLRFGWFEDGQGGITHGYLMPNAKDAVAFLARGYKEGLFSPDYTIKKGTQTSEDFQTGKAGIIGNWTYTAFTKSWFDKAYSINKDFRVAPIPPLTAPDGYKGYGKYHGFYGFFVMPASLGKDEGKVKKLLSILDDQIGDEGAEFMKWGVENDHFKVENGEKMLTDKGLTEGTGKYLLTNHAAEGEWIYNPDDTDELKKMKDESFKVAMEGEPYSDQSVGLFSPTYSEKGKELDQYLTDQVNKIILGERPVDDYDKVIQEWKDRGGEQVVKEFNEAYQKRKNG